MDRTQRLLIGLILLCLAGHAQASQWQDRAQDAWIDGKVEAILLFHGRLNTLDINTDVTDGTVILTGKVASDVDKQLASELAASIDGVTAVDNRLSVVSATDYEQDWASLTGDVTDAKIATVIRARLLMSAELRHRDISVDVSERRVILRGLVRSASEAEQAVAIATNTADVGSVKSELSIDS